MSKAFLINMSLANNQSVNKQWDPPITDELLGPILSGDALSGEKINNIPARMIIKPLGRDVPDIIGWETGPYFVSEKVKQIMVSIDRDICKFVPIKMIQYKQKKEYVHDYYLLIIDKIVDSVDVEASDIKKQLVAEETEAGAQEIFSIDTYHGKCTVRKDMILGLHLWRNIDPFRTYVFCSETVAGALKRNSIKGWHLIPCEVNGCV